MSARRIAGFVLLLAAAIGSGYLARTLDDGPAPSATPATAEQGFYLRAARIFGTGEDGRPLYEIEAEYAEQQGDDAIRFENVRVRYSPDAAVPWQVAADSALINKDRSQLLLDGHVLAVSQEGFAGNVTEIRTDRLQLEPERYRAMTDARVQIRIGERSLTATGMEALLDENRLRLQSNVSGKFAP